MSKPSVELWFELETRCNLSCKFCYNFWKDGSSPEPGRRSTGETIAALRALFESVNCTRAAFSGGEPLLRRDLPELVRVARSYGVPVIVTTNGILLTPERIRELMECGVVAFQVPIHSHIASVHDELSGGKCWRQSLAAMIRVRESGSSLVPVFVATRRNLTHFPAVLRIAGYLGARRIIFNRFIPTGLGVLHREEIGVPSDEELIPVLDEADRVAAEQNMSIRLGTPVQASASTAAKWRSIELSSCPVQFGQRRWTLSADLTLRRCNQSGAHIGSVQEDGLPRLLDELRIAPPPQGSAIRSCGFVTQGTLVQIDPGSSGARESAGFTV